MGLLQKLFGRQNQKFSLPESFAAIAIATIASDGYLLNEERQRLLYLLSTLEVCRGYSESTLIVILDQLVERARQKGIHELVEHAKQSLPDNLRPIALGVAADLAVVDGTLAPREEEFLTYLWQSLEIPGDMAWEIIEFKVKKEHRC